MKMEKQIELKTKLDKWYSNYCKKNKKFPSYKEMMDKAKELGLEKL